MNSTSVASPLRPRRARRWFDPRGVFRFAAALCLAAVALSRAPVLQAQAFVAEWSTDDIGRLGPTGMAIDTIGGSTFLYVADDVYGRILKFDLASGARVAVFGETGDGDGQFNRPFGIAIDPVTHDLFIAERGNHRISRITSNGAFVMKWGMLGAGAGQFYAPVGVAADASGHVYVSDYGNHRVQKFRVQGGTVQHLSSWGTQGTAIGQFHGPYGIALDPAGDVWVADSHNHRLQKFNGNGVLLQSIGSMGTGPGQFIIPTGITFDRLGAYYVSETNSDPSNLAAGDIQHQRIQKFSATGAFEMQWGSLGERGGQFRLPLTLAVDANNFAYVSDYYNTRLQKFDLSAPATPPPPPPPPPPPTGASGGSFINVSSRLATVDGDASRTIIAGFVVNGTARKQMLVRAVGPGLAAFGVTGTLANPTLRIYSGNTLIAENHDWNNRPDIAAAAGSVGAFALPADSADAAVLLTLDPGVYSAQVVANGGAGVALVEVYDAQTAQTATQLVNLSTRGYVETGAGVLVAGFVISGDQPKRVLVRGIGPALAQFGVSGTLGDSQLKVMRGDVVVAQNDDWETPQGVAGGAAGASAGEISAAAASVGAFALPAAGRDAAVLLTLQPGAYSAVVSGAGESTGAGLVEVYEIRN